MPDLSTLRVQYLAGTSATNARSMAALATAHKNEAPYDEHIVRHMFSFLLPAEDVWSVQTVCRAWRDICGATSVIWRAVVCDKFAPERLLCTAREANYDVVQTQVSELLLALGDKHEPDTDLRAALMDRCKLAAEFMVACRSLFYQTKFLENDFAQYVRLLDPGNKRSPPLRLQALFVNKQLRKSIAESDACVYKFRMELFQWTLVSKGIEENTKRVLCAIDTVSDPHDIDFVPLVSLIIPLSEPSLAGALGEYYMNREMDHIAATVREMLLAKKSSRLKQQEATGYDVCDGRRNPREVLGDVCGLLFSGHQPFGFKGNTQNYYSSANSYMNQVIDRRRGIPITLSLILVIVCKRLGIRRVFPVGMAGHFICSYLPNGEVDGEFISACPLESGIFFIDSFHNGRFLSREQCHEFMGSHFPTLNTSPDRLDAFLHPVLPKNILQRVLQNLVHLKCRTLQDVLTKFTLLGLIMELAKHAQTDFAQIVECALQQIRLLPKLLHKYAGFPAEEEFGRGAVAFTARERDIRRACMLEILAVKHFHMNGDSLLDRARRNIEQFFLMTRDPQLEAWVAMDDQKLLQRLILLSSVNNLVSERQL